MSKLKALIDCESNKCKLKEFDSFTTALYYPPMYDKFGRNINEGRSTRYSTVECLICGRIFRRSESGHRIEFTEMAIKNE